MATAPSEMHEPSIDTDKLSYEIFSILESKFLFGYDDRKLWIPKISPANDDVKSSEVAPAVISDAAASFKNQRGKVCILSVDGGGLRNIIAGKALACLEDALRRVSGDSDARIADFFDVAAGTGVGGIFTAMLFGTKDDKRPIFSADDTWRMMTEHGKSIYGRGKPEGKLLSRFFNGNGKVVNSTAAMEKVVKSAFIDNGKCLTLRNTLKPILIPCYDLSSSAPFLFSRADAIESDSFDFRLWEVCRATSAEPGLFEPVEMRSVDGATRCVAVDGGLAMTNPTAAAITHVLHNKQEFPFVRGVEDILVLSVGSGVVQENFEFEQVRKWKAKDWARPMARISSDASADLVDHSVAMAFGSGHSRNYVRIQANGSSLSRCRANVECDPSPKNLKILSEIGDEMLRQKNVESSLFEGKRIAEQSNFEKLDWFARELVSEHQKRSCRIAPTVAFKQANQKPT
ncbi:Patatin [Heracleum sosnowskyi]|uniref:Patatin n=1 Tax=Heracleum sosnowskyi TaxID=360622 RepID=A0AAD8IB41_9APIA|nr:Patatin [Heracleum sosnowskyi]